MKSLTINALNRLTEKVERANAIQHSGGIIEPDDWSELHQLTNEARGVLELASPMHAIGHELRTQDNRITSHPIFFVQQKRRFYGVGGTDNKVWMRDGEECDPHTRGSVLVGYIDTWVNVQPFFTEAGAKSYLECNGHNLKEPRIYVESGWRNEEWQAVRNFLITQ